jgi:anhydro-N-acetylmuramic acid kinase
MLLNHLVKPLNINYDTDGLLARSGQINTGLLHALDALPYYRKPYPKSTGYEWFREAVLPLVSKFPEPPENQLRTGVQHIANQIAIQVRKAGPRGSGDILVTGGGALNLFLMEVLQDRLAPDFRIVIPDREIVNYKEAIVFGFLGALRLCGQNNVLASVTGARRDSCSGTLCTP